MSERGIGSSQIRMMKTAEQKILKVLQDGEWHRYQNLQQQTGLSTATLSKHLKDLEKGIVERRLDQGSNEYPPPVYYRIKQDVPLNSVKMWREFLMESIKNEGLWLQYRHPEIFIEFLNQMIGLQALENLEYYFYTNESEETFEQSLEYMVISVYRDSIQTLKNKLKELGDKGENLQVIIANAQTDMGDDFRIMWDRKFKRLRRGFPQIIKKLLGKV